MSESNLSCQPLLDKLTHVLIKTKLIKKFTELGSLEKKLLLCLSNDDIKYDETTFINIRKEINNLIDVFYSLSPKHGKCLKKAEHFRAKGSKSFVKMKDDEAFKLYTEGLKHAPCSSPIVPILYANRSAVHFQKKNFEECLTDIERAEKKGYPLESISKLYKRKIESLYKLGREKEGFELLQSKKTILSTSDNEKISKFLLDFEKGFESLKLEELSLPGVKKETETFNLFCEEKSLRMSGALKIRVNNVDGRHIKADRDIPKGSLLFKEKPFASILLPEYFATHCQNCFSSLVNPIPCDFCCDIFWCSEKCLEEGSSFHQYECSYLHILTSVGIAHLSLRILLIAGWEMCQLVRNERIENQLEETVTRVFESTDKKAHYKSVWDLISHFNMAVPEDQFQYCLAAIILAKVLTEKTKFLSPEKYAEDDETFLILCSILVHHISQLVSNAHAITQIEASATDDYYGGLNQTTQNRIATAIYPLASLMNHSCLPSIINSFSGDTLIIHSIEDIKKGEQIFNCYGPHACRQQWQERQTALHQQYFFKCRCKACTDEHLLVKEKNWNGITCPNCGNVVEALEETSISSFSNSKLTIISCEACGTLPQEILNQYSESIELHQEGEECFKNGNISEAETHLTKALNIGEKIYVQNNNFLNIIRDDLAKCYAVEGKFDESLKLLDTCINTIEFRYGKESVEVGHELVKYLYILQQSKNNSKIENIKTRIEAIFTTNYGKYWKNYLKIFI